MNRPRLLPILTSVLLTGTSTANFAPANNGNDSPMPSLRRTTLAYQDDPAAKKKAPPKDTPEQREQIIRRLHGEFEDALSNLEKQNTGAATRDLQNKIVNDLNKLIDPPNKTSPPPAQQQGHPKAAKAPNDAPGANKNAAPGNRGQEMIAAPSATKEKAAGSPTDAMQQKTPGKHANGPWGEMRPQARQALDAYANDRFMRCYEELLRQYYRAIAEAQQR